MRNSSVEIGISQIKIIDNASPEYMKSEVMNSSDILCEDCQKKISDYRDERRENPTSLPKMLSSN